MNDRLRGPFFCLALVFAAAGCATLHSVFDPEGSAGKIAADSGFLPETLQTKSFRLASWRRIRQPGSPLTLYIEGDGRAWQTRTRLSNDPTPQHPLVLEFAAEDDSPNVAYLARPCQYGTAGQKPCGPEYWSGKRFSEEVIASMDQAVTMLAERAGAKGVRLVGYSGGGAVAVLVAARRSDVLSVRTIAGNLDPEAVNRIHAVTPLDGSLNPMDAASKIRRIPQRHFTGTADTVVPPEIAYRYLEASGGSCVQVIPVRGATHRSGWVDAWQGLSRLPADSCA